MFGIAYPPLLQARTKQAASRKCDRNQESLYGGRGGVVFKVPKITVYYYPDIPCYALICPFIHFLLRNLDTITDLMLQKQKETGIKLL